MSRKKLGMLVLVWVLSLVLSACGQSNGAEISKGALSSLQRITIWQGRTSFVQTSYYPDGIARSEYYSGGTTLSSENSYDLARFEEIARLVELDEPFNQPVPELDLSRVAEQPYYYTITLESTSNQIISYTTPAQLCDTNGCLIEPHSPFFDLTLKLIELNRAASSGYVD